MKSKAPIFIACFLGVICIALLVMLLSSRADIAQAQTLTLGDVTRLSDRGLSLSWADFEEFEHESSGTSQRIVWAFSIAEPGYSLSIDGNSTNEPPANILLTRETGNSIEVRTGDILAFLAEESTPEPVPPTPPVSPTPPAPQPPITPAPPAPEPIPTFSVIVNPSSYDVSVQHITVTFTNTSQVEGSFGLAYRIDRYVNGTWEAVPLDFVVPSIAMILSAGQSTTETFSLHQDQFAYQPGTYRIVFLDGLDDASAQFTLTGNPTYSVSVQTQSLHVTAEYITVRITNTSQVEGGYGYGHRIERYAGGRWEIVPLDTSPVISIWMILSAGQTVTYDFSLYQEQFDYQPGRYRVVLLGVEGQPSAEFTLF